jgi:uncharacterized protein
MQTVPGGSARERRPNGADWWAPPYVQWVVKASKFCNLRCRYCYEYPFLANRERMGLDQLAAFFQNIVTGFAGSGRRMDFVWHGGEPLVQEPSYFRSIWALQRETLGGADIAFTNSVQTNLVALSDDILELLREFFTHVGVSVDLFGGQRVNVAGHQVQEQVLRNMQKLVDEGVRFGCITVLSRSTLPHIDAIFEFFEALGISFRLLPIYRTGYPGQQDEHALSNEEIVSAFKRMVDLWFAADSTILVRPVHDYIAHAVRYLDGGKGIRRYYSKRNAEIVYIVDTDGSLYSNGDAYDSRLCHGNVFTGTPGQWRSSPGFQAALAESEARVEEVCGRCRFHGACSGYFVAEATPEQRTIGESGRLECGVAMPVQAYVESVLLEAGLVDRSRNLLVRERLVKGMRGQLQDSML